jgi:hypothetical protein
MNSDKGSLNPDRLAGRATNHLPVIQPVRRSPRRSSLLRSTLLRSYRLTAVVAIIWIIHHHHVRLQIDADAPISVKEVKPILPAADRLRLDESDRLGLFVLDSAGARIGYVLRTAPISNDITGYVGPTDTLVVLDRDMRVAGIRIRSSHDTAEHVGDVARDDYFMKTWNGKSWDEVAGLDPRAAGIEGVSGASLTSLAIANGIQHRFRRSIQTAQSQPAFRVGASDVGLVIVLVISGMFTFTHMRSRTWLRRGFQVLLVGYLGFWNGRLIAISLMSGWATAIPPWRIAPGLVLLVLVSLAIPWTTRRGIYCSHVCPHGVLQEWMSRIIPWRIHVPPGPDAALRWIPFLLIATAISVALLGLPFNLAAIEPFDAYLVRSAGMATIAVAIGGLFLSAFIPMGYCKYGCPTGAVLNGIRSHGMTDRIRRKDIGLALLLILTCAIYVRYDSIHHFLFG